MLSKLILFFGEETLLICDGRCEKAWGKSSRPSKQFDDEDDFAYLADDELGLAPRNPRTYQGISGDGAKPIRVGERLNRWCARECERSELVKADRARATSFDLPDFSKRFYNQPWKHHDK